MEDYPKTLMDLERRFATEEACREYLFRLRWPSGFHCPACGHEKAWPRADGLFECGECGHKTSVKAGTIFEGSRKPLALWFRAIWWVTSQKNGASALGLQRILGLGSYETAWTWMHKLRRAMVRPGRDRLSGSVQLEGITYPMRTSSSGPAQVAGCIASTTPQTTASSGIRRGFVLISLACTL